MEQTSRRWRGGHDLIDALPPTTHAAGTNAAPAHSIFSPLSESVTTAYLVTSAPVPAVVGTATIGIEGGVSVRTGAL
jgi:hypothetical protein